MFIDGEMSVGWHGDGLGNGRRIGGESKALGRGLVVFISVVKHQLGLGTRCISEGYREVVDVQRQVVSKVRHVDQDVNRA